MESSSPISTQRVLKSVEPLSESDLNILINEMYSIRELLYFSVCREDIFRNWVEQHASSDDKRTIRDFGGLFASNFLPGVFLNENELTIKQQQIYLQRQQLMEYRTQLIDIFADPATFEPGEAAAFGKILRSACNKLDKILVRRESDIRSGDLALTLRGLDALYAHQKQFSLVYTALKDQIEDYLNGGKRKLNPKVINSIYCYASTFMLYSEAQRGFEKNMVEKRQEHEFQAAIMLLMLENNCDKLLRFFRKNPDIAAYLHSSYAVLKPLQQKFKAQVVDKNPQYLPCSLTELEKARLASDKMEARLAFKRTLAAELAYQHETLFKEEVTNADHFDNAEGLRKKGQHAEAISLFMRNARQGHVPSLLSLSEMVAQGEGCENNLAAACHFARAAVVYCKSAEQKKVALDLLKKLCKKTFTVTSQANKAQTPIDKNIRVFAEYFADLKKLIINLNGSYIQSYLNAADAYFIQYKLEVIHSHDANVVLPALENACKYFEEAYAFARAEYDKKTIIYEKNKEVAEERGLDVTQEKFAADEDAALAKRVLEANDAYTEAEKQCDSLRETIARKIGTVYLFVGDSPDKQRMDKLCKKMEIIINGVKQEKKLRQSK